MFFNNMIIDTENWIWIPVEQKKLVVELEGLCDSIVVPDGAALSIYQCIENVRNFLVAVEQMGLPTFETSDLVQLVVSVLARSWKNLRIELLISLNWSACSWFSQCCFWISLSS